MDGLKFKLNKCAVMFMVNWKQAINDFFYGERSQPPISRFKSF